MIDKGVKVRTPKFLTDQYGVTEQLTKLGVEVGKTNEILTETLTERSSHIVSLWNLFKKVFSDKEMEYFIQVDPVVESTGFIKPEVDQQSP